jgi:hypothetical protein
MKNEIERRIITESELIDLVEKRGVGVYPFKKEIDEIVNYVQTALDDNLVTPGKQKTEAGITFIPYEIQIPFKILSKFDWIDDFKLTITVRDVDNLQIVRPLSGNGFTLVLRDQKIIKTKDGFKLNIGNIDITCYSVNKQLQPRTIYLNLYHEFNHDWEIFNRLKSNNESDNLWFTHKKLNYSRIINGCNDPDKDIKKFCYILYRLWIPDEFNAIVASIYGDLEGMKSISYTIDYKSTKTYEIYQTLKIFLNNLKNLDIEKWKKLSNFHITSVSPQHIKNFKEKFITQTEQKLSDLFHRMNRTASLYYENKCGNIIFNLNEFYIGMPDQGLLYEYDKPDGTVYIIDMIKHDFDKLMELYQMTHSTLNRFNILID